MILAARLRALLLLCVDRKANLFKKRPQDTTTISLFSLDAQTFFVFPFSMSQVIWVWGRWIYLLILILRL